MRITKKQIALVHVARHRLGLDEETYRDILAQFGVRSSKELTVHQFKELMEVFKKMGFKGQSKPAIRAKKVYPSGQKAMGNPNVPITDKQKEMIWRLWNEVSRAPEDKREMALNKFVKRIAKVDHWRWLSVGRAQKVIVALKKMVNHDG